MFRGYSSSVKASDLMSPEAGLAYFQAEVRDVPPATCLEAELITKGIGKVAIPVSLTDFQTLDGLFEELVDDNPPELEETYHEVDRRYGNEAGYQRKDFKTDKITGIQESDGKSFFHFNEHARTRWVAQFPKFTSPKSLSKYLGAGFEIQDELLTVARNILEELHETHPKMADIYFLDREHGIRTQSFLRHLLYDGYPAGTIVGDVGKEHFDIGGLTIQAYADASGFWAASDGYRSEREYIDTEDGYGYAFMGKGHKKLYSGRSSIKPLLHGVGRIVSPKVEYVKPRHAAILFVDTPTIDPGVVKEDTLPQLFY